MKNETRAIKCIQFIEKSNLIHENKYDYSNVIYINCDVKVNIKCFFHGIFTQTPYEHLKGHGCSKCAGVNKLSLIEFINKSNIVHNNKYDYSKVIYNNNKNKIVIICKKHGEFSQTPNRHLQGDGCPICGFEKTANDRRNSMEEILEQAKLLHNDKYDYSHFIYKNNRIKGIIICSKHGTFQQCMDGHINQKQGCPNCSNIVSKLESEWLDFLNVPTEYRQPKKMKINNLQFKPDAYNPATNTIYEFYGDYWHGNPEKYNADSINKLNNKNFGDLYNKTIKREADIMVAGYNLISIWETDWNLLKKAS